MEYLRDVDIYVDLVKDINRDRSVNAYVCTFGCQQNEADSEKIRGLASEMGYALTDNFKSADLIIINTCAIREHAEEKALSLLGNFKSLKRNNPDLVIGVCGCMAAEEHISAMIKNDFHYVSFTLEPNMIGKIPMLVYKSLSVKQRNFVYGEDNGEITEGLPIVRTHRHKAFVSIMYGCNNFCSYCIVPYVRGRERSRSSVDIINECRELVQSGCREITLLGQNVNSYSSDINFASLIEKIALIEGDFIIRFMTSHPKDVSDELIEVMAKYRDKVAPYFHLPLQSGSNSVLKAMNRRYDRDRFLSIASRLKEKIPNICLSTDVIIGFPGESDEDFEQTLDILKTVRFDIVYSFIFSKRKGTPAYDMKDINSADVKEKRMNRLLELQDEISLENNIKYLNTVQKVLVDSKSKSNRFSALNGRTDTNKLVHFEGDEELIGSFVNVKIIRANGFNLIGEIIKNKEV